MLGKIVTVVVDRPLGSFHPKYKNIVYPINYGYIPNVIAGDGEEQDAYILGVDTPLTEFTGIVVAVIHRKNDMEDKLIVAPPNMSFSKEEILKTVYFQEQFFDIQIVM